MTRSTRCATARRAGPATRWRKTMCSGASILVSVSSASSMNYPDRSADRKRDLPSVTGMAEPTSRRELPYDADRERVRRGGLRGEELLAWLAAVAPTERERAIE